VHRLDVKAAKTQHFSFIYGNVGNSLRISRRDDGINVASIGGDYTTIVREINSVLINER